MGQCVTPRAAEEGATEEDLDFCLQRSHGWHSSAKVLTHELVQILLGSPPRASDSASHGGA